MLCLLASPAFLFICICIEAFHKVQRTQLWNFYFKAAFLEENVLYKHHVPRQSHSYHHHPTWLVVGLPGAPLHRDRNYGFSIAVSKEPLAAGVVPFPVHWGGQGIISVAWLTVSHQITETLYKHVTCGSLCPSSDAPFVEVCLLKIPSPLLK